MRTFSCRCGNALYFENTRCFACGHEVSWCEACHDMVTLDSPADGTLRCASPHCGRPLVKCHNYAVEGVCNRCVEAGGAEPAFCRACRYNAVIPDLSVAGNRLRWQRLEHAKRRVLYELDMLGLTYGSEHEGVSPALAFEFLADAREDPDDWYSSPAGEPVYTGHANGRITINIREADDLVRERIRVEMNEQSRSLVGHFRHEFGHYYFEMLVIGHREQEFIAVFGDPASPGYARAQERHYRDGPPADWNGAFVSGYAAMHPWEDFAETFAVYLAMSSLVDSANSMRIPPLDGIDTSGRFDRLVARYLEVAARANELNRGQGLAEITFNVTGAVSEKLEFVHRVIRDSA